MRHFFPPARSLALVGVAALHVLVFWLLSRAMVAHPPGPRAQRPSLVTLRLIPLPPAPSPPLRQVAPQMPPSSVQTARVHPSASAVERATGSAPGTNIATVPSAITPETAAGPDAPASAAEPQRSLLETEASRRAIRESAAAIRDASERGGANERLAAGIKGAGKGDCSKGDYPGGGMGLLSLPFLAAAVATGNCAK